MVSESVEILDVTVRSLVFNVGGKGCSWKVLREE